MSRFNFTRLAAAVTLAAGSLLAGTASAAVAYSDVYIFGDSLSDPRNTQALLAGFGLTVPDPSQPYLGGRFSDGLLWTEHLAAGLGQAGDANSYLEGGKNFAYAGARTGGATPSASNPIPGVLFQAQNIWGSVAPAADANALYVVVGGGNDMRDAREIAGGTSPLDLAYRQLAAEAAIANLKSTLGLLAQRGAEHVLISNLPDLGNTPEAVGLQLVDASRDVSNRFNALVPGLISYGSSVGLTMSFLDMAGVVTQVRNNPGAYGITNLNLPCTGFTGADFFGPGTSTACSASAFSDALHPSGLAHRIIANAALQTLGVTPVPEPGTVALMLAGLGLVGAAARRKATAGTAAAA